MNKEKALVYNENYPATLSEFSRRYFLALELFRKTPLIDFYKVVSDFEPIDLSRLVLVHKEDYVRRLARIHSGEKKDKVIPKDRLLFDALATKGSELAVDFALREKSIAYHLGGGFHHAFSGAPGAYDYCNDVAFAAARALEQGAQKVLIVDLDVHHPNGTQEIFWNESKIFQVSFHGSGIYPGTGLSQEIGGGKAKGTKFNLPLPPGIKDEAYLSAIDKLIIPLAQQIKPELIIYQAGVDTHHADPLGNLKLTLGGLFKRDQKIFGLAEKLGIGVAIIRGGGYNDYFSPRANVNTLAAFAKQEAIFAEKDLVGESTPGPIKTVEKKVAFLRQIMARYNLI